MMHFGAKIQDGRQTYLIDHFSLISKYPSSKVSKSMAEYGAHLNQSATSERPTFFEVIAQESMTSVLRPAITYALKIVASSHPDNLGWLWGYGDEIYSILDYTLQNFYLKRYCGTFSEHFYGLKRLSISPSLSSTIDLHDSSQSAGGQTSQSTLSARQRYYSLLTIVLIPYFKLKLDQYFEKLREETGEAVSYVPRRQEFLQHLKRVFLTVYPFIHCSWEAIFLCYQLMYMFTSSDTHSPLLHWIGLRLQRLSREDILAQTLEGKETLLSLTGKSLLDKLYSFPSILNSLLVKVLANGLPVIVFFLKFLEWWYSSENSHTVAAVTQLPIPPPPPQPKPAQFGIQLPSHPAQCALCKKVRTNPTVLSTSGYVFCYPCIYRYLGQHGCCPVTHLPSTQEQLVRLYINKEN